MADALTDQLLELTEKIHHLETHAAYQEDVMDSLNQTIGLQQQDILQLKAQLKLLSEFIRNMKHELDSGIKLPTEETPPPHY